MKRFISTKLFLALQETSQTGIDGDAGVLKNGYDEFAMLLFSNSINLTDKLSCLNMLVYTRVEFAGITGVSEKKMQQPVKKKLLNFLTDESNL